MQSTDQRVPLLVLVPNRLRVRLRVEAARQEKTIAGFVMNAIEAQLPAVEDCDDGR